MGIFRSDCRMNIYPSKNSEAEFSVDIDGKFEEKRSKREAEKIPAPKNSTPSELNLNSQAVRYRSNNRISFFFHLLL